MLAKISNAFHRGRRRFIAREEPVDTPEPELPVVYHAPPVSKFYPPTGTTNAPTTSRLQKSASLDYASTPSSKGVKEGPRTRSGSTDGATSRPTTFRRSKTSDITPRRDTSRWGQKDAAHTADRSCETVTSPVSVTPPGARKEPYPQTYPGSRTSQDRERSLDLSDESSSKLASPRPRTMGRRSDTSPRTAACIEELPEPPPAKDLISPPHQRGVSHITRGSSADSASSGRTYVGEETSKGSILGRRQEKRARALAMEAAQQVPRPRLPIALEHISPSPLKPPDSPLVQHAPRKAQPFLGRSQTIDVATISQPTKDIMPPSPVPPWRSKEKPSKDKSKLEKEKQKAEKEKQKERQKMAEKARVSSPTAESPLSPKSNDKNSKSSSQRVLSPTALLVASSSRLMSPVGMPSSSTREAVVISPTSPPPLVPVSEKDSPPVVVDEAQARADRIALYKEQRRKELANLYSPPGQDARGKNNADTNLENFMKHAKKYGLDKSPEEKEIEERKLGTVPLIATVAPMATSTVASVITSTALVTSPITTSDSKGSAVVTLSKSNDTKPVVSSPLKFTSPSTLTATRVTPTQSLTSMAPSKPVSVSQSHTSSKATSLSSSKRSAFPEDLDKRTSSQKGNVPSASLPKITSPIVQDRVTSPVMTQKVISPIKDSVGSPEKADSSSSILSPQNARKAFFAELAEFDKDLPSLKPSPSFIPKVTKPAMLSPTVASPVTSPKSAKSSGGISPTPLSPMSSVKSKIKFPSKVLSPGAQLPVTVMIKEADPSVRTIIQPGSPPPLCQCSASSTTAVISTVTASTTNTVTESTKSLGEARTSISVNDLLKSGRSKLHGDGSRDTQKQALQTSATIKSPASVEQVRDPERRNITDGVDKVKPVFSKVKQKDEVTPSAVEPTTIVAASLGVQNPESKPAPHKHPMHLHIEKTVAPEVILKPKLPPLAQPEELVSVEDETIPENSFMNDDEPLADMSVSVSPPHEVDMDELEAEVRLMEQILFSDDLIESPMAVKSLATPSSSSNRTDSSKPTVVGHAEHKEKTASESYPKTPTSPVSHADLYEQAIANKKLAAEEENTRREEEVAAEVELKRALQKAGVQNSEHKAEAQTVLHHPVVAQAAVPQAALPQAALPQAALPQAALPQAALSQVVSPLAMPADVISAPPPQFLTSPKEHKSADATVMTSSVSSSASKTPSTPVTPEKTPGKAMHLGKVEEGSHHRRRLKELQREDSFNRADSPIREPMPLPKDSVIARHRQSRSRHRVREDSSSSESGTSPARSPRASPRSPRKPKVKGGFTGGRDSTRLGVDFVPQERERGRSGRPERHQGDVLNSGAVSVTSGFHPQLPVSSNTATASPTSPPSRVPTDQSASSYVMGQSATKPSPDGAPGEFPVRDVSADVIETSSLTSSRHGSDASSLPLRQMASSDLASLPTGSVTGSFAASDSSNSTSSRRERKRFKKRDLSADDTALVPEVKVRPGKKDKSSIRKSALNTAIDEEEPSDTRRTSDARRSSAASDEVLDTGGQRSRTGGRPRDDPLTSSEIRLTSPESHSDVTSPVRHQRAKAASPIHPPAAITSPTRTLSPVAIDKRVKSDTTAFTATDSRGAKKQSAASKESPRYMSATAVQPSAVVSSPTKDSASRSTAARLSPLRRSPEKQFAKSSERQGIVTSGRKSPDKSVLRRKSPQKSVVSPTASFGSAQRSGQSSSLSPREQSDKKTTPGKVSRTITSPTGNQSIAAAATSPVKTSVVTSSGRTTAVTSPAKDIAVTSPHKTATITSPIRTAALSSPTKTAALTSPFKTISATSPVKATALTSPSKTTIVTSPAVTSALMSPSKTTTAGTSSSKTTTAVTSSSKNTTVTSPIKTTAVTSPSKTTTAATSPSKTNIAVTSPSKTTTVTSPSRTTTVVTSSSKNTSVTSPIKATAVTSPSKTTAVTSASKTSTVTPSPVTSPVKAVFVSSPVETTTSLIHTTLSKGVTTAISSSPVVSTTPKVVMTSSVLKSPMAVQPVTLVPSVTKAIQPITAKVTDTSPPIGTKVTTPTQPLVAKVATTGLLTASSQPIITEVTANTAPLAAKVTTIAEPMTRASEIISTTKSETTRIQTSSVIKSPDTTVPISPITSKTSSVGTSPIVTSSTLATSPTLVTTPRPVSSPSPVVSPSPVTSPIPMTSPTIVAIAPVTSKSEVNHVPVASPMRDVSSPTSPVTPIQMPPIKLTSIGLRSPNSPTTEQASVSPPLRVTSPTGKTTPILIKAEQIVPNTIKTETSLIKSPAWTPSSAPLSPVSPTSLTPESPPPLSPVSPPPLVSSIQITPTSPIRAEPIAGAGPSLPVVIRSQPTSPDVVSPKLSEVKPGIHRSEIVFGGSSAKSPQQKPVQEPMTLAQISNPVLSSSVQIHPTPPTSPSLATSPSSATSPPTTSPSPTSPVDFTKYGIPEKVGEPLEAVSPQSKDTVATTGMEKDVNFSNEQATTTVAGQSARGSVLVSGQSASESSLICPAKKPAVNEVPLRSTQTQKVAVAHQTAALLKTTSKPTSPTPSTASSATSPTPQKVLDNGPDNGPNDRAPTRDVSELVRRFSSPESDHQGNRGGRSPTPRSRRTPERSQSMREESLATRSGVHGNGVVAVGTPGGSEMNRKRFNAVPADEQLARILNRRSKTLEEWEAQIASSDDVTKAATSQDQVIKEFEEKLEQQRIGRSKRDSETISDDEVLNALKVRREEVDTAHDATDGRKADDNQAIPAKTCMTSPPASILKRPDDKPTPIQISSILTSSRENTADSNRPIHTTSILKRETHLDDSDKKLASILRSPDAGIAVDNRRTTSPIATTTVSSFASTFTSPKSPTPSVMPTHQSSTFIMVTSSNRKPADPYVELPSSGAHVTSPKGHMMLQRSETLRENSESVKENKEPERRTLKPILRKAKTVDVSMWDPELESVLKQRRERPGEDDTEDSQNDRPTVPLEAAEEEQGDEPKLSIAERIFRMETKIEESKFSKSYAGSGATTPRVLKLRTAISGPASPTLRSSDLTPLTPEDLEENEVLFAKLADVAVVRDAADRRREKSQQRKDDDWRTRTTPVTQVEVNEADRLESELRDIPEMGITHNEPTPTLSRKKMVRKKVEAARAAFFEDSDSDFDKLVELNKRRAQGVMSPDVPVQEVKEEVQDDLSKMSVSQKMALFRKMEDEEKEKKKNSGSKRFADRRNKRMERSRTQPITEEEIGQAAVIAKEQKAEQESQAQQAQLDLEVQGQEEESRPLSSLSMENLNGADEDGMKDDSTTEDDLSKLSLAEKMKLFSQEQDEKNASAPKRETPVTRRKTRRLQSRFKTQSTNNLPVTTEEVEKAAHRISPLALSLVKPPDPEVLGTMSLKDQKDFMARWAMETLQQLGSRPTSGSGSRPVSRGPGSDAEEENEAPAGTAKDKSSPSVRGILKPEQKAELERELRGILRAAGAPYPLEATLNVAQRSTEVKQQPAPVHGILKKDTTPTQEPQVTTSILKKDSAFEPKLPVTGVLKKEVVETVAMKTEPERSALKKDSALKPRITEPEKSSIRMDHGSKGGSTVNDNSSTKGILRKDTGVNHTTTEVKSMLKVTAAPEVSPDNQNEALKRGILKTRTTETVEVQPGILRSPPKPTVASPEVMEVSRPADLGVTSIQDQSQGQSSTEESESSGSGVRRIKNEAVARRRQHRELRKKGERYHTQPVEGSTEDDAQVSSGEGKRAGHQRHHTQPVTSEEKEEAESGKVKDGIASRPELTEDELALLQRSGEEDWKKRVLKKENTIDSGEVVKMREKRGEKKERPSSIADRLSLLQGSQDSWRDRIEETDVRQFTVAGKLELQGKAMTPDSPLLARRRKPKVPLARALSTPTMHLEGSSDDEVKKEVGDGPVTVDVPHAGEGVEEFFQSRTVEELSKDRPDVTVDDFDHIFLSSQDILPAVQKARPQTRRAASSRNPLKTLAQRRDLQNTYIQVQSGVADREMRRIKRDQIAGSACFATEALAGLAATENFASVMLRKTDSFTSGTPGNQKLEPYREVMLMQVKGRRHCQTRLVAPDASSLNSGDCFILVTPERCWVWVGDFSNVIEKAKAVEVAGVIQAKRDLGCKSPYEPTVMEESAATVVKRFWEVLGGEADYQDVGPAEEDEVYEADMAETVRVYRLAGEEFVLWEEVSGCVPRYEMLNTKDILIFDFGSEFYLWTGKQAAFSKRKVALKLARNMWAAGYDYTEHGFNPMSPLTSESQGGLPLKDIERPDWTLFGKVNQNMETVLFREKFFDWPDASRLISVKGQDDIEPKADGNVELAPYDVTKMIPIDTSPVTMVLEGSHVGRGNTWTELYEGLRREYEISTLATKVWHVNEYQVMDLDDVSYGQFHDGDTYVVRWQYMIMQTGMKTLKGASARHSLVGRERCAYFFWQGRHSSVNEKGASALMTVELDEERGPQVRVLQDKEQPCFLNLFKSKMVVHIGKREAEDTCTQGARRLYIVRNELSGEAHLTEVPCSLTSLRSRGVFVLVHVTTGQILLWNGAKSGINTRQRALEIAQNLKSACPAEMGIKEDVKLVMTKMDEGCETQAFWEGMGSQDTTAYMSLLDDVRPWLHTPRLFLMSSVSGEFRATEVVNPCRSGETVAAFPFLQTDLYTAPQPAQLMIDNHHEVYLWQGWWPEGTEEEENISTGSAVARFNIDRCCAMETVLNYCQTKAIGSPSPAFVVYAGLEPKVFTNIFPYWENNEEAATANIKEGKKVGLRIPVKDVLKKLTSTRYTYDELQERPLPDGVDPMRIEAYLKDDEFQRVLGMTKEEFYERPGWKQSDMKKEFSLF